MLHAFMFVQSGIPVLYSGDEIGQKNDYDYHNDPIKCEDSRYLHRGDLRWDEVARRNDPSSREGRIFGGLQELIEIRREYGVFEGEARTWTIETYNNHVLGIGRYYKGEKLIALFNFSDGEQTAWISEVEDYYNLITGEHCLAENYRLEPYGFVWLMTSFNRKRPMRKVPAIKAEAVKAEEVKTEEVKSEEVKVEEVKAEVPTEKPDEEPAAKKPAAKKPARKKTAPQKEVKAAEAPAAEEKAEAAPEKPAKKAAAKRTRKPAAKKAEAAPVKAEEKAAAEPAAEEKPEA